MSDTIIKTATEADRDFLSHIARSTFFDTYSALNPENGELLEAYVQEMFSPEKVTLALKDPNVTYFILEFEKSNIGYAKVIKGADQALELEKLYFRQDYQGLGLGKKLFEHIRKFALEAKMKKIWLGVYDQNEGAINFYTRLGFTKTGEKDFTYNWNGTEYKDKDLLLELKLV